MSYGNLTDFWSNFGINMGSTSGRNIQPSGSMVDDFGTESLERSIEREAQTNITEVEQKLQS